MARPKTKEPPKTVGQAKAGDRVAVQYVLPYETVLLVREEWRRRMATVKGGDPEPSVSDVLCDLIKAGLAKGKK